jgi:hypothetical protein
MTIEAMKQALKALEKISKTEYHIETPPIESLEEKMRRIADNAITDLRQAIEQAEKQDAWTPSDTAYRPEGLPQDFIKHEVDSFDDWSEWVCPDPTQYFMKCCDCGLVHKMQFKVVKYSEGDECEPYNDPNVQIVFRARRHEVAEKQENSLAQTNWDNIPQAFNDWWNADYDDSTNPFRLNSPAYWAWSGWSAANKEKQEPVAWMYPDDYERMLTSETFCTVYSVEVGSATRGESTVALYTTPPAAPVQDSDHEFKNFHRLLCERFGYTHDEVDWKRDQISLIEWIAKQVKPAAPVQEPVAAQCKFDREVKWGWCEIAHHNLVKAEPQNWPGYQTRLLYTTPPAAQPEPEFECPRCGHCCAQRQPLTDDEIWKFWWSRPAVDDGDMESQFVAAVRAVLAAHGIGGKA